MKSNIVLIGFIGTLKSSLGYMLSRKTNMRFFDTDTALDNKQGTGRPILLSWHGESYVQAMERQVIANMYDWTQTVISCGGGIALDEANMKILCDIGIVVLLKSPLEDIIERASRRSFLMSKSIAEIDYMIKDRNAFYEQYADLIFYTAGEIDKMSINVMADNLHREIFDYICRLNAEYRYVEAAQF